MSAPNLLDTFHAKYEEFAADLLQTFPELTEEINLALKVEKIDRPTVYTAKVLTIRKGIPNETLDKSPGLVLPGVSIYGWNQYLWPLLATTSEDMYPVVVGIRRMMAGGDSGNQWNLVMATAVLAMLPPTLVVVLMQRWFVKGLVDTEK